jgi:hypothetical protein
MDRITSKPAATQKNELAALQRKGRTQRVFGSVGISIGLTVAALTFHSYLGNLDSIPDIRPRVLTGNSMLISAGAVPLIVSSGLLDTVALVPREALPLSILVSGFFLESNGRRNLKLLRTKTAQTGGQPD